MADIERLGRSPKAPVFGCDDRPAKLPELDSHGYLPIRMRIASVR
ncbi:hypothetical protein [Acidomonas methanolica]|nr:hypothetical protein [Acidomonas methanolica]